MYQLCPLEHLKTVALQWQCHGRFKKSVERASSHPCLLTHNQAGAGLWNAALWDAALKVPACWRHTLPLLGMKFISEPVVSQNPGEEGFLGKEGARSW